ncbi:MAG TPA: polysaccharide biosynthesis protein, partial [Flavobacterium sp.]|nr:polysaccharide biosynthesis protein [Flavobacterium sp.]
MFIVFLASIVTYVILSSLIVLPQFNMPIRYAWIIMVNAACFFIFKTYSGIIRHSTFIDGVKLLASTSTAFSVLITINYSWYFIFGQKLYLTTGLLISYVISFLMLFLFRIMVKNLYERLMGRVDEGNLIKTVIYGADANAISVANALKSEVPPRFRLRGFIDRYQSTASSKRILNLPIVPQTRSVHVILRAMKAEALIIAEKGLTKEETIALVEECLEYNIKVYSVPLITDWEDAAQISNRVKKFEINDLLERKPIQLHMDNISRAHKGKRILITGAAGSIGSEITRQVVGFEPEEILILDQAETPLHSLVLELSSMDSEVKYRPVLADIRNKDTLSQIFRDFRPH